MSDAAPRDGTGPLVTIVTPSLNHAPFIRRTIESVLSQDYSPIEYLVIDGGSTDGTLDILREYEDRLTWISEPDRGTADAVNKGLRTAQGEVLNWVNSDDELLPGAVTAAIATLEQHPEAVAVYGSGVVLDIDDNVMDDWRVPAVSPRDVLWVNDPFLQPATFIRAPALDRVGPLNDRWHWVFDWDLYVRLLRDGPMVHLDRQLAAWRRHDDALTQTGGLPRLWEIFRMLVRYRVPPWAPVYRVNVNYTCSTALERASRRASPTIRPVAKRLHHALVSRRLLPVLEGGIRPDGWAAPRVRWRTGAQGDTLRITGVLDTVLYPKLRGQRLTVYADDDRVARVDVPSGSFVLTIPLLRTTSDDSIIELRARKSFVPRRVGINDDGRHLAFQLDAIAIA